VPLSKTFLLCTGFVRPTVMPPACHTFNHRLPCELNVLRATYAGVQELDSSEKQWVEVCGQIDKLDKFFRLGSLAMTKAREAQAAAIARGMIRLIT